MFVRHHFDCSTADYLCGMEMRWSKILADKFADSYSESGYFEHSDYKIAYLSNHLHLLYYWFVDHPRLASLCWQGMLGLG